MSMFPGVTGYSGVAYLPLGDGLVKVKNCMVEEMSHEYLEEYHQTLHGRSLNLDCGLIETRIVLRYFGKTEEVKEPPERDIKELNDYTNLELLEELEKRTSNRDLLSS